MLNHFREALARKPELEEQRRIELLLGNLTGGNLRGSAIAFAANVTGGDVQGTQVALAFNLARGAVDGKSGRRGSAALPWERFRGAMRELRFGEFSPRWSCPPRISEWRNVNG